jgi:hypothetical protein
MIRKLLLILGIIVPGMAFADEFTDAYPYSRYGSAEYFSQQIEAELARAEQQRFQQNLLIELQLIQMDLDRLRNR